MNAAGKGVTNSFAIENVNGTLENFLSVDLTPAPEAQVEPVQAFTRILNGPFQQLDERLKCIVASLSGISRDMSSQGETMRDTQRVTIETQSCLLNAEVQPKGAI